MPWFATVAVSCLGGGGKEAAGEVSPVSRFLIGLMTSHRRSVCAPGMQACSLYRRPVHKREIAMSRLHSLTMTGIARGKLALCLFVIVAIVATLGIGPVQSLVAGPQATPVVTLTSPVNLGVYSYPSVLLDDPLVVAGTATGKISSRATVEIYTVYGPVGGGNVTSSNGNWSFDLFPPLNFGTHSLYPLNLGWNELEIYYIDGKVSAYWAVWVYLD